VALLLLLLMLLRVLLLQLVLLLLVAPSLLLLPKLAGPVARPVRRQRRGQVGAPVVLLLPVALLLLLQ
jgi:hypothetical protein